MKKMTAVGLGVVMFSTLFLGSQTASASVTQPEANSEATVVFKADDSTTPPVIVPPVEGGEGGEVDPDGSDGGSGDGNASFNIAYVSHFRFNNRTATDTDFTKFEPIKLNANGMNLWAKGTQLTLNKVDKDGVAIVPKESTVYENLPNFVQVVDNRGTNSGWHLNVEAGAFTGQDAGGETVTLKGAEISLNQATLVGPEGVLPSEGPVVGFTNATVLTSGAQTLLNAQANTGTGSWSLRFGQEEIVAAATHGTLVEDTGVKLSIPASAQAKADVAYTANIKWVLTDGPKS